MSRERRHLEGVVIVRTVKFLIMFTTSFKCLLMIRGVNISTGVIFVKGLTRFGVYFTCFLFLGMHAIEY